MYGHNLVAVYESFTVAERVKERLIAAGFGPSDVRLSAAPATQTTETGEASARRDTGFWAWLFGDVSEADRGLYTAQLRGNRAAVSVRAQNETLRQRALEIMDEFDPIDLDNEAGLTPSTPAMGTRTAAATRPVAGGGAEQREQVIPVVKEELSVGKRATERRYRVRTHVIEKPVEEQVTLRDERVEIEHRPVSGAAAGRVAMPQERDVEIVERHEEPVVEKRGRTTEEVVARKEVTERPETVRGTVRETEVDVDKEPATSGAGSMPPRPTPPRR